MLGDTIPKKRKSVLTFHNHSQNPSRDFTGIFDVSQSTVSRIIRQFKDTGTTSLKRKAKCGRKSKTSAKDN